MRKSLLVLFVVVLMVSFGAASGLAADAPAGPQPVTNYGERPVDTFNHDTHKHQDCVSCHHNEGDGKYRCGECHKLEDGDAPRIRDAFHGRDKGACRECHTVRGAEHRMKCKDLEDSMNDDSTKPTNGH